MRILEGVGTVLQLAGLLARLCKLVSWSLFLAGIQLTQKSLAEHETRAFSSIERPCIIGICFAMIQNCVKFGMTVNR